MEGLSFAEQPRFAEAWAIRVRAQVRAFIGCRPDPPASLLYPT
jgi:hypothetical protein